jgi:hypothetical protein
MNATASILYVGTKSGTCEQRARTLTRLGRNVTYVESEIPPRESALYALYWLGNRFSYPPDMFFANSNIKRELERSAFDVVWIDKGRSIRPGTLRWVRRQRPETRVINYSPDNMFSPFNTSIQYRRSIPLYDLHITTKSFSADEFRAGGAKRVFLIDKAFDPKTHRPLELSDADRMRYGADISFIGVYEREMGDLLYALAEAGLRVVVWGRYWNRYPRSHPLLELRNEWLEGIEYTKAINATRINLGLLRTSAGDLHTARSVEIPSCRAFMLGQRTEEHLRLFAEGEEAEFFSSTDELLAKCRHYLEHDDERRRIAEGGYRRCIEGGYDLESRLESILTEIERL